MRSSSGAHHDDASLEAPVVAPAMAPAVAPAKSVCHPTATANPMVRSKSPSPCRTAAATAARFGGASTPPYSASRTWSRAIHSSHGTPSSASARTPRTAAALREEGGTCSRPASTVARGEAPATAALTAPAAHIAAYTPLPRWVSNASRSAPVAAPAGSRGRSCRGCPRGSARRSTRGMGSELACKVDVRPLTRLAYATLSAVYTWVKGRRSRSSSARTRRPAPKPCVSITCSPSSV